MHVGECINKNFSKCNRNRIICVCVLKRKKKITLNFFTSPPTTNIKGLKISKMFWKNIIFIIYSRFVLVKNFSLHCLLILQKKYSLNFLKENNKKKSFSFYRVMFDRFCSGFSLGIFLNRCNKLLQLSDNNWVTLAVELRV